MQTFCFSNNYPQYIITNIDIICICNDKIIIVVIVVAVFLLSLLLYNALVLLVIGRSDCISSTTIADTSAAINATAAASIMPTYIVINVIAVIVNMLHMLFLFHDLHLSTSLHKKRNSKGIILNGMIGLWQNELWMTNTSKHANTRCTKNAVSITDFFRKCDQIRSLLRIWSYLLEKSVTENFIFCAACVGIFGGVCHSEVILS